MAFQFTFKGSLGTALPGLKAAVSILDVVKPVIDAIKGLVTVALTVVAAIKAIVAFIVDLALLLLGDGADALAAVSGMVNQLADQIFALRDATVNGAVSRYEFNGSVMSFPDAVEAYFAKGSPGSKGPATMDVGALVFFATDNNTFKGLKGFLGPHRASGLIRLRFDAYSDVVLSKGTPIYHDTNDGTLQYGIVGEGNPPMLWDPSRQAYIIPGEALKAVVDPAHMAKGTVRLLVRRPERILLKPTWRLVTGDGRVYRFDFTAEPFSGQARNAETDGPFLGWRVIEKTTLSEDTLPGPPSPATGKAPLVYGVDLPIVSERPGADYNLPAEEGLQLRDRVSEWDPPEDAALKVPHGQNSTGTVRILVSGSGSLVLTRDFHFTSGTDTYYPVFAELPVAPPPDEIFHEPFWCDPERDAYVFDLGTAPRIDWPADVKRPTGAPAWAYGLELAVHAVGPKTPEANRSKGAEFKLVGGTPEPLYDGATIQVVNTRAITPLTGTSLWDVPGIGRDGLVGFLLSEPLEGGAESADFYTYLDLMIEAPDGDPKYNLPEGAEFRIPERDEATSSIGIQTDLEIQSIKAIEDLSGGVQLDIPKPTYEEYPPKPGEKTVEPTPITDFQLTTIKDLAAALNWKEFDVEIGGTTFKAPPWNDIAQVTTREAEQFITYLRTKVRNAKQKPGESRKVPVPNPTTILGLEFKGREAMGTGIPFLTILVDILDGIRQQIDGAVNMLDAFVNKNLNQKVGLESIKWEFEKNVVDLNNATKDMEWHLAKMNVFGELASTAFNLGDFWVFKYEGSAKHFGAAVKEVLGAGFPDDPEGTDRKAFGLMYVCEDKASWGVMSGLFGGPA